MNWQLTPVTLRFQLSDWVLFNARIPLQVRIESLADDTVPAEEPLPPSDVAADGARGYLVRNLPLARELPPLVNLGTYLRYIPLQYSHCYIDLDGSFEQYTAKFSSKTRSTLQRKVRKFAEQTGGSIVCKSYSRPEDMDEFFGCARTVSKLTYQERLLDAGLPDDEAFRKGAMELAQHDCVRAYILFDRERPVSYLYCPVQAGVLIYSYLGYDPEYQRLSPGTVLQWLALEQLFAERKFRYFDFTEGQGPHKQLFASHTRLCGNVFFIRRDLYGSLLVRSHRALDTLSARIGAALDRFGIKGRIKKLLRRGMNPANA